MQEKEQKEIGRDEEASDLCPACGEPWTEHELRCPEK